MAHIILVHGLGATDKSWFGIPKSLEDAGHTVNAVLLPDGDTSGLEEFVKEIVSAFPSSGQCVLVGHSMGGISISQAAAENPDRISKLIYVAALVPADGQSTGGIISRLGTSFDNVMKEFDRLGIDRSNPARRSPVLAALMGVFETRPGFENIPKHYIGCSNDTVVKPMKQDEMIGKWVFSSNPILKSGHIPQKEVPRDLTDALLDIIN